jgi:hypothetical protein
MSKQNDKSIPDRVLAVLPPQRAKAWLTSAVIAARDPSLRTRSLYGALNWLALVGKVVRRPSEVGRWEYARAPKSAR